MKLKSAERAQMSDVLQKCSKEEELALHLSRFKKRNLSLFLKVCSGATHPRLPRLIVYTLHWSLVKHLRSPSHCTLGDNSKPRCSQALRNNATIFRDIVHHTIKTSQFINLLNQIKASLCACVLCLRL